MGKNAIGEVGGRGGGYGLARACMHKEMDMYIMLTSVLVLAIASSYR